MQKKLLTACLLLFFLCLTACGNAEGKTQMDIGGLSAKTDYVFNLEYDNENHQLAGKMKATIKNCSGDTWQKIVIND